MEYQTPAAYADPEELEGEWNGELEVCGNYVENEEQELPVDSQFNVDFPSSEDFLSGNGDPFQRVRHPNISSEPSVFIPSDYYASQPINEDEENIEGEYAINDDLEESNDSNDNSKYLYYKTFGSYPSPATSHSDKGVFGDIGIIDVQQIQLNFDKKNPSIVETAKQERKLPFKRQSTLQSDIAEIERKQNQTLSKMERFERRGSPVDWNKAFQEILDMKSTTEEQSLEKHRLLSALSADFVHTAKRFGKIIISESKWDPLEQTLKPALDLGGQAGGPKYTYHGILFKFATDFKKIYKSEEGAMKAAGHELKGVMRYNQFKGLHVPLVAIIDYRGYRLVAESILPIKPDTLAYGSGNAGATVHTKNEKLNGHMKKAGEQLNLKGHFVGKNPSVKHKKYIYGPVDIEGHVGADGRFYVLDFARVFPPTFSKNVHATYLYELFRPEFVQSYCKPLSSDGLSNFGNHNKKEHDDELIEATASLLESTIPQFAQEKLPDSSPGDASSPVYYLENLTEKIHRAGINVRYLGLIRYLTRDHLKPAILNEICARAIKNCLRKELRAKSHQLQRPQEDIFRNTAFMFLNVVLGRDSASRMFWCRPMAADQPSPSISTEKKKLLVPRPSCTIPHTYSMELICPLDSIKQEILHSFGDLCLTDDEKKDSFDLRVSLDMIRLFQRIRELTGVRLTKQARQDLKNDFDSFELVQSDIVKVAARVKHMNIIPLAEAEVLAIQTMKDKSCSKRLFRLACSKFETAIQAIPDNLHTLRTYGEFLVKFASQSCHPPEEKIKLYEIACEKFVMAKKNYGRIFEISQLLLSLPFSYRRDELCVVCYTAICTSAEKNTNNMNLQKLKSQALFAWGRLLVLQARTTNNDATFARAGDKYKQALAFTKPKLDEKRKYSVMKAMAKRSGCELALLFEIFMEHPKLDCFDSSIVFKTRMITAEFLRAFVSLFTVRRLFLSGCDHLTSSQLVSICKACSIPLVEIDFSNCTHVNDSVINIVREKMGDTLTTINLSHCKKVTSKGYGHLGLCDKIRTLHITHCNETAVFMGSLNLSFRNLQILTFSKSPVVLPLVGLALLSLKELDLSGLPITNIPSTVSTKGLKSLTLHGCTSLTSLDGISGLESLLIRNCKNLSQNSLCGVLRRSPTLRKLNIRGCKLIGNETITTLTTCCPLLEHLDLLKTESLTSACMAQIFSTLSSLVSLTIRNVSLKDCFATVDPQSVEFPFRCLESLALIGTSLSSEITFISRCVNLKELDLSYNKEVPHEAIEHIVRCCGQLTSLKLEGCLRLTDKTIQCISQHVPQLECLSISKGQCYCNLSSLQACTALKSLQVEECSNIAGEALCELVEGLFLEELNIIGCVCVADPILNAVLARGTMRKFSMSYNKISTSRKEAFLKEVAENHPDLTISTKSIKRTSSSLQRRVDSNRK